jgi:hypothetical protein
MALKPPARGGSSGRIGQGLDNNRRLSELLVKQTYGGAADSVLTDWVLASAASDNKTGTVTGTVTYSGTIVGKKATTGAVAGTITLTGTVVGKEGEPGAVVGTVTYTGTVAGTKAATGVLASDITYSGLIVGTADDPDRPPEGETTGGGGGIYRAPYYQQQVPPPRPIERKSGRVIGVIRFRGYVEGHKTITARRLAEPILYRCEMRGHKQTSGHAVTRTRIVGAVHGVGITQISTAEIRRMRQEIDLLYLTRGTP